MHTTYAFSTRHRQQLLHRAGLVADRLQAAGEPGLANETLALATTRATAGVWPVAGASPQRGTRLHSLAALVPLAAAHAHSTSIAGLAVVVLALVALVALQLAGCRASTRSWTAADWQRAYDQQARQVAAGNRGREQ